MPEGAPQDPQNQPSPQPAGCSPPSLGKGATQPQTVRRWSLRPPGSHEGSISQCSREPSPQRLRLVTYTLSNKKHVLDLHVTQRLTRSYHGLRKTARRQRGGHGRRERLQGEPGRARPGGRARAKLLQRQRPVGSAEDAEARPTPVRAALLSI